MKLFILGLRRSGTTIFWRTFRQDRKLVGYDEPFNPKLWKIPISDAKGTWLEFIQLFRKDPKAFWEYYAPIHVMEELQPRMSDTQQEYLQYLIENGPECAIDFTRCHFKLETLKAMAPDAVVVHLYRRAPAFASSHLVPSGHGPRVWVRKRLHRHSFWTRPDRFYFWGIEQIVGTSPESLFAIRLREAGLDPEEVYRMPAVGKLLAFWKINFERIEADGHRLFGSRFLSVNFERFCREPRSVVKGVYEAAGMDTPSLDYGLVHASNRGFRPDDHRWREYAARLRLPREALPDG